MSMARSTVLLDEPGIKDQLDRCIQNALDSFNLRTPRTEDERRDGFAQWLQVNRKRFAAAVHIEFKKQFGGNTGFADRQESSLETALWSEAWPNVEEYFRGFAVRALAARWATGHLGDKIQVEWPQLKADEWVAALTLDNRNVGQITLDSDGNVVPASTTKREDILKALNGR